MQILHAKTVIKTDGPDASRVLPSDWNDEHVVRLLLDTITAPGYVFADADRGRIKAFDTVDAGSATLPAAQIATDVPFGQGWFCFVLNLGAGVRTLYPDACTIDGAASLALASGEGGLIVSHAGGYFSTKGTLGAALAALAALTPAADKMPYFTGASAAALTTLSALGRTIVGVADGAAARAAIGAIGDAELQAAIDDLVGGAPGLLDTLSEIAAALGDNPDVIDEILTAIGGKADAAAGVPAGGTTGQFLSKASNDDHDLAWGSPPGGVASFKGRTGAVDPAADDYAVADIDGLSTALAAKQDVSEKGAANGYASLDGAGKVPSAQLPASDGGWTTGDIKPTIKTTADAGWVMLDDGTIGNASSGASTRANADTKALFTLIWNNISNTYAAVSGGRGANAAADFAANKTIALPKALGRALAAAGTGSGLTARALGQTIGTETHSLSTGEMPSHAHNPVFAGSGNQSVTAGAYVGGSDSGGDQNMNSSVSGGGNGAATTTAGSGSAHNNMQPSLFVKFMIKL